MRASQPSPAVDELGPAGARVKLWFRSRLSTCSFAARLVQGGLVHWGESLTEDVDADFVHQHVQGALATDPGAPKGRAAALVFPKLCDAEGIAKIVGALAHDAHWLVRRSVTGFEPNGAVSFEVHYRGSMLASVAGFAPIHTMPITRRSPCTTLVVWAGERAYEHMKTREADRVGLIDSPLVGVDAEQHDKMKRDVTASGRALLRDPAPEFAEVKRLLSMTFCVPITAATAVGINGLAEVG